MVLFRESGHKAGTRDAQETLEITKEIGFHVFNKYARKSLANNCFSCIEWKAAKWTLE